MATHETSRFAMNKKDYGKMKPLPVVCLQITLNAVFF